MTRFSFAVVAVVWTLTLAAHSVLAPAGCAQSQTESEFWQWRFQPSARSQWKVTIFGRLKSLTVKDMIQSTFSSTSNGHGDQTSKRIHPQIIDQASHRALFDVEVLARDEEGCLLRWTFRQMTTMLERDGWAEHSLGDPAQARDTRPEVQERRKQALKQWQLGLQRDRAREALAGGRFTHSLAGASFSCAVDAGGRVTRFGGWLQWKQRVAQSIALCKDGGYLERAFRPVLAPDEMQAWVQGWTEGVPATPMMSGHTWQYGAKIADLSILTPLSTVMRTLQSQDETRAVIEETGAFTLAPPVPNLEPNSVAYTFSCQGTRQARLQVERASGVPTRISRRLETKGHRGVVNDQGGVLQDEAFTWLQTSEIVAQLQPPSKKQ